jgi:hypothetical protein
MRRLMIAVAGAALLAGCSVDTATAQYYPQCYYPYYACSGPYYGGDVFIGGDRFGHFDHRDFAHGGFDHHGFEGGHFGGFHGGGGGHGRG